MTIPDDLKGAQTRDPERLERRRRLTLELRCYGWSWKRIAKYMGVSESTARHRVRRLGEQWAMTSTPIRETSPPSRSSCSGSGS